MIGEPCGSVQLPDSLWVGFLLQAYQAHAQMRQKVIRIDLLHALQHLHRFIVLSRQVQDHRQRGCDHRRERVSLLRPAGHRDGFLGPAHRHQKFSIPVIDDRLGGMQFNGP